MVIEDFIIRKELFQIYVPTNLWDNYKNSIKKVFINKYVFEVLYLLKIYILAENLR